MKSGTRKRARWSTKDEDETVNQASALWSRAKNDISEEQYKQFYQHISHDRLRTRSRGPTTVWKAAANTRNCCTCRATRRSTCGTASSSGGLKLYVKRVFIMDDAEQLLPTYLRFVKGVVDSSDLPLNVSREILQESRDVRAIRDGVTKRSLSMLEELANSENDADKEKYASFWKEFGQVLKEGIGEDYGNRERIAKLVRFASTHTDSSEQTVALADYVARMKPEQTKIYYVTADTWQAAKNSPHLEVFRKKGVEVLLLTDRVDEWMLSFLNEFDGKPLQSVARGDLDLGALNDEEKQAQEKVGEEFKPLVEKMKEALKDKAKDVRLTFRLTDSPSCLVADDGEMSGYLAAHAEGRRPAGAVLPPDSRSESGACAGQGLARGQRELRRLVPSVVRSGLACRRRRAGRSGKLREVDQCIAAGARRVRRAVSMTSA